MTLPVKATASDIYHNLMGCGWKTWSWWLEVNDPVEWDNVPDDWKVTGRVEDPNKPENNNPGMDFEITNAKIIETIEAIINDESVTTALRAECMMLLIDPERTSFDSGSSDYIIQRAIFGKGIYS